MTISATLRLAFWIALVEGASFLLARYTDFPLLHWVPVAFLGAGIYIFKERPIARAGYAPAFETAVAALLAFVFFSHLTWIFLEPKLEAEKIASLPCGPKSIELQCYTFSQSNCASLFEHFSEECRGILQKELAERPSTALVGPRIKKCTYRRLDQSFRSNRRTPTNPACETHFKSLEGLANQ